MSHYCGQDRAGRSVGRHRRPQGQIMRSPAVAAATAGALALVIAGSQASPTFALLTAQAQPTGTVTTSSVAAPTSVTYTRTTANNVLTWTASTSTFVTGYNVYRATTSGGPYTQIGSVSGRTTTTFTDTAVPPTGPSYYVVKAVYDNWYGDSVESAASRPAQSAYVLREHPIAYWRLGETAGAATLADSSGNGRSATNSGMTLGQPSLVATSADTSATVDGTGNTYATAPNDAGLQTDPITIEMWIRTPTSVGSIGDSQGVRGLLIKGATVPSGGSTLAQRDYNVYTLSSNDSTVDGIHLSSARFGHTRALLSTPLAPNTNHYIAIVANSTVGATFYVDGVKVPTDTSWSGAVAPNPSAAWTTNPVYIGRGDGPAYCWSGGIDEVAIYNTTLTAQQISDHYHSGI